MTIKTPFMVASEIDYYANRLWQIATHQEVAEGHIARNEDQIIVQRFGETDPNKFLMSGQVSREIADLFCDAVNMGVPENDQVTRDKLKASIGTLTKILDLKDPSPGFISHFSNLQQPLADQMVRVVRYAQDLKIDV